MIKAQNLSRDPAVRHMFFSRQGGISSGIYFSLNCGLGSSDLRPAVVDNRARAMAALDQEPNQLVTLYQTHSPDAVRIHEIYDAAEAPKADGMVTTEPGIVLGILTADCAPVLFADAEAGVIGAAHAGWKGALGGVLDATVDLMVDAGAQRDRISAAVGPCIQQASYEVGTDFRTSFLEAGMGNERFFKNGAGPDKFQFDLSGYVSQRLDQCNIGSIEALGFDTYAVEDRFFSYRRATHRKEPDYGRQLSAIVLKG
ncbi:MAG: peptidoglycan editing factor PgeF [Rhodospirillales bacterium]|jgi:polyphenol oxidase|nr:peptidoglycan editing factor PgeF [Rhodospirillales bacterium]